MTNPLPYPTPTPNPHPHPPPQASSSKQVMTNPLPYPTPTPNPHPHPPPQASSSKQVMEFLEHVAQSSAALVYSAGLPPDWVQALSRPVASHGAQHSPRNAWSAPHPQQQQLHPQQQHSSPLQHHSSPQSSMGSRPNNAKGARPLTPLDVAADRENTRSRAALRLQPQSAMVRSPASDSKQLPSASILASYDTVRTHLNAARELANF